MCWRFPSVARKALPTSLPSLPGGSPSAPSASQPRQSGLPANFYCCPCSPCSSVTPFFAPLCQTLPDWRFTSDCPTLAMLQDPLVSTAVSGCYLQEGLVLYRACAHHCQINLILIQPELEQSLACCHFMCSNCSIAAPPYAQ